MLLSEVSQNLDKNWKSFFQKETGQDYFNLLNNSVEKAYSEEKVYPPRSEIFHAFRYCGPREIKVIILGQDPYHQYGQAHGLAFSVCFGQKIPRSLSNIYKELKEDLALDAPSHGHLKEWAVQGVLLLNTVLTVKEGQPDSHKNIGWEIFTSHVIEYISGINKGLVFMLWGEKSKQMKSFIKNQDQHLILESGHPSPLSVKKFFGCRHFSKANEYLQSIGKTPVNWALTDDTRLF